MGAVNFQVSPPGLRLPEYSRALSRLVSIQATPATTVGVSRGRKGVKDHLGRPTKIEGNSNHPESLGATDAITQAAILSLYDPERSSVPRRQSQASDWAAFDLEWTNAVGGLLEKGCGRTGDRGAV